MDGEKGAFERAELMLPRLDSRVSGLCMNGDRLIASHDTRWKVC